MQSKSDQESIPNVENITDETKSEEGEAKNSLLSADFLKSIENDARHCSENLISMMSNLQTSLHAISELTIEHMELYQNAINVQSGTIQKSMIDCSNLMSKCRDLAESLKPVDSMAVQVKEIKKNLELLESQLTKIK
eukprot:TRINITY_DN3535_c0_g1_i1.p1 TRINITY_DN3535_c0_g1~~TRINITY_DN3535_c0_g1_i1.p1  ORF type:complete len:153 (-),score=41.30 TRINITY_DN3535_c0_g1_i1:11-421(-)